MKIFLFYLFRMKQDLGIRGVPTVFERRFRSATAGKKE